MRRNRTYRHTPRAFSLVEVMVSAAIGTGVVLMMALAIRSGTEGYQQATGRIDALVEARAALSILADDATTMVGVENDEFGWIDSSEFFHEIYFLTLKPASAQDPEEAVGDVCYVHYFTAVTPDAPVAGASVSRKLYRRFLSSAEVLVRLSSGQLPTLNSDPDGAEVIAFNVTRFLAQPLSATSDFGPLSDWEPGNGVPEALSVHFQVVDNDTARLLSTESDWNLDTLIARQVVLEDNEEDESNFGRNFYLDIEIGHDN